MSRIYDEMKWAVVVRLAEGWTCFACFAKNHDAEAYLDRVKSSIEPLVMDWRIVNLDKLPDMAGVQ